MKEQVAQRSIQVQRKLLLARPRVHWFRFRYAVL